MKLIFSTVRKLFWLSLLGVGLFVFLVYLIRSNEALITHSDPVSAKRVEQAKKSLHNIAHQLNNSVGDIEFTFSQPQVDALMAVASFTVPDTQFKTNLSEMGVHFAATTKLTTPYFSQYINWQCTLLPSQQKLVIERCRLGKLSLPDWLVMWGFKQTLLAVFEDKLTNNVLNMVQKAELSAKKIKIKLYIKEGMKQEVLSALHRKAASDSMVSDAIKNNVNAEKVAVYLDELQQLIGTFKGQPVANNLAFYIGKMFYLAQLRTPVSDASTENQAVLWALATTFGNKRFGHFVGIDRAILNELKRPKVQLSGRGDLALHFLYSAVLERVVKLQMGLKVGELKELLDSNTGGSGFSFADLTADKSGLAFADIILNYPLESQKALVGITDESVFFPSISGLIEGLSEAEFNQSYGSTESAKYKQVATQIDKRIAALPLHQVR